MVETIQAKNSKANQSTDELRIDVLPLKKAALILRAINHKLRMQILKLIHTHGKLTVTEIYVKLRLEQSVASQHLAILRRAGMVDTVRDGKFIYYSVNYERLTEIQQLSKDLIA
jgi:DNA-binding transcriptional ArsR family regulator